MKTSGEYEYEQDGRSCYENDAEANEGKWESERNMNGKKLQKVEIKVMPNKDKQATKMEVKNVFTLWNERDTYIVGRDM